MISAPDRCAVAANWLRERRISDDHLKVMLAELKRLTILRRT